MNPSAQSQGNGIRIEGLRKRFGKGDTAVDALKHVDMQVAAGEVVGLIGPSGSGKSTLLKCLGAVIDPTAGRMELGEAHCGATATSSRSRAPRTLVEAAPTGWLRSPR